MTGRKQDEMNINEIKELTELLAKTWNNGAKMIDYCLKSSKYIVIDNMFVDACKSKPSISKTLWYSDVTEGPEANFLNFKELNHRNNMPRLLGMRCSFDCMQELYLMVHYSNDKTGGRLVSLVYDVENSSLPLIRKVTESELEKINAVIEEVRKEYDKRLESYYKKYSHKVTAEGYWADR